MREKFGKKIRKLCSTAVWPIFPFPHCTGQMGWIAHRKLKETKQQPDTAGPGNMHGCCLVSLHFQWAIHTVFSPSLHHSNARYRVYEDGPKRHLSIRRVGIEDLANYSCLATNSMGKQEGIVQLTGQRELQLILVYHYTAYRISPNDTFVCMFHQFPT